jgi:DnaJ homolog subfamily B member 4
MTNSAKKASKTVVLLQAQALDPAHSLGSAASLAVEGQPSRLHHLASLVGEVIMYHQTLWKYSSEFHYSSLLFHVACWRNTRRTMFGMGGLGGLGGMSMFDNVDDMGGTSAFSSFRTTSGRMPGGMGDTGGARYTRTQSQPPPKTKAPEITRPLKISLEDIYGGMTKRLKVSRRRLDGSTEEKVLEIAVQPGWKEGTKVRFPRWGNENPDGSSPDLVFVVEDKPHVRFSRSGNDLIARVEIPLVEALTNESGSKKQLEHLDGRKLQVQVPPGVVKPGQETKIAGEGMPTRGKGATGKGDLLVRWDVKFPDRLTPAQKEGVRRVLGWYSR